MIPSYILYFILLYLMFFSAVKSKFCASFYWIFGFSAITYIIHSICYYTTYRFTSTPLCYSFLQTWPTRNVFYPIIYTLTYYTVHVALNAVICPFDFTYSIKQNIFPGYYSINVVLVI